MAKKTKTEENQTKTKAEKAEKSEKKPTAAETAAAIAEMFEEAAPTPRKKKTAATDRDVIEVENLQVLAATKRVIAAMESIYDDEYDSAKAVLMDHFMDQLVHTGQKPVSINAECGESSATIVFVASAHAKPTTAELMEANDVPFERRESIPARLVINPAIVDDQELLGKLANALKTLDEFQGMKIIQRQDAVWKVGVTDDSFAAVAKIKDDATRAKIFQDISGMQLKKPCFNAENSLQAAVDYLREKGLVDLEEKAAKKGKKK